MSGIGINFELDLKKIIVITTLRQNDFIVSILITGF